LNEYVDAVNEIVEAVKAEVVAVKKKEKKGTTGGASRYQQKKHVDALVSGGWPAKIAAEVLILSSLHVLR
jgi:hypothetical protein